ncbi:domain found in IF2B/IF5-domain-containing protein [Blastocladiella britannica]|nr:domain found in IF2B/IF5-domain-containing protein [Blastocladiella britannica]
MSDRENAPIDNEEIFDPSTMKKKKAKKPKKAVPAFIDEEETSAPAVAAAPAAGAADDDEEGLDFSKLKKKKAKKAKKPIVAAEDDGDEDAPAPVAAAAAPTKVKKASRAAAPVESGDEANEDDDDDNIDSEVDEAEIEDELADEVLFDGDGETAEETWISSDRDYTFDEVLSRFYRILHQKNPALGGNPVRIKMIPPEVNREGSKKTAFANLAEICERMRRSYEHVTAYLYAELGTSGSVDGSQRLIIRGRFQPKQIENVLRRYIVEYVACKTCKSPQTILRKENRLFFVQCESCGSQRSVSAIQTGFRAQGSRKAAKAKAAA